MSSSQQREPSGRPRTRLHGSLTITAAAVVGIVLQASAVVLPQFGGATNFSAGAHYGSIVVADFNSDGKTDIAVALSGVSVLLGVGDGRFAAPADYSASGPNSFGGGVGLAAGDFNNDGNLDLVTSGGSVLLGDGRGGFPVRSNFNSFSYVAGLAVGDFDGDGNLDLALAAQGRGFRVLFGRGDGSFGTTTDYLLATAYYIYDIRAGDIYSNGRLDLALSLSDDWTNSFCILSNRGDGTFAAPVYYADTRWGYHPSLELGDFNGDGRLDVAVLDVRVGSLSWVTIWTNGGHGHFAQAYEYALGSTPTGIAKGDFNGDGKLDLVVCGGGVVTLLLGNGDGSFVVAPPMPLSTGSYGTAVAVGSFSAAGTPDLAFVTPPSVAIMLNQTPPTLQLAPMAGYNQLTWPNTFGAGFTLECTTNLVVPASWQPFPWPPVLIGNQRAVTDWRDGAQKFYRLRKPQ